LGHRRMARELAMQLLYQIDMAKFEESTTHVYKFWEEHPNESDIELFATIPVKRVIDNLETIDETISEATDNWKFSRIAPLERNILRIAVAEMLYITDIPAKVSINEAIEITKQFGSSGKAPKFVNGVLDRVYKQIEDNDLCEPH